MLLLDAAYADFAPGSTSHRSSRVPQRRSHADVLEGLLPRRPARRLCRRRRGRARLRRPLPRAGQLGELGLAARRPRRARGRGIPPPSGGADRRRARAAARRPARSRRRPRTSHAGNFVAFDAAAHPGEAVGLVGEVRARGIVIRAMDERIVRVSVGTPRRTMPCSPRSRRFAPPRRRSSGAPPPGPRAPSAVAEQDVGAVDAILPVRVLRGVVADPADRGNEDHPAGASRRRAPGRRDRRLRPARACARRRRELPRRSRRAASGRARRLPATDRLDARA